ncbi:SurA N-terminal domain-containing protein [Aromatoleum toluclasticum]|uniref:SurA N-terminal domain-containing protein n=1 Tax=Aromatoleum toluclasticum TaxID=92003 RepID=UPI001D182FFD|nr:SurA N-terminal domain-containing protein [Aromatoleum toluclasticum]MCC4116231.1 SurA N-terminal domain-containing protein [Aromatoleum toluclasticum]
MLESVRNNKRAAQIILALLIVPFAFFGLDSYFRDGPGGTDVATVGKSKISTAEFDQALREQQDRLRESMGGEVDRALLDSEPIRRSVVENLVNQRLLALHAADSRLIVTPQQLQQVIAGVDAFQQDGRFSIERYEAAVRAQGMTPAMFESRLAQDLRMQQVAQAIGDSAFASRESIRRFLTAQLEERKISELQFPANRLIGEVKLADDAAKQYYDANGERFERPARLRAEYVVFNQDAVLGQVSVSDEAARKFYETNAERFSQPEERSARHILISAAADASADAVTKANEKAAGILKQLRADPKRFAELAKAESQDPGSASRGGDLGFFGRGAMVKPFEDAVFSLGKGQVSEVVRSDFGFHIIEVTDIKPAHARPFDEVKGEIVEELKRQEASKKFAEQAEVFSNTVYEQADSLKPVAEALKLQVRTTDWIERVGGAVGDYTNEKLLNALFSDEAMTKQRNVEAVEVSRGTLVSARVVEHQAAQRTPFEQVKGSIEQQLKTEQAAKLAVARGEAALASLQKGESVSGEWSAVRTVQRAKPELAQAAISAVFGAPSTKLPAYVGAPMAGGGYSVFRIESVNRMDIAKDDPRLKTLEGQYQRLVAERDFNAFLTALRGRYAVNINTAAVRPQQQ